MSGRRDTCPATWPGYKPCGPEEAAPVSLPGPSMRLALVLLVLVLAAPTLAAKKKKPNKKPGKKPGGALQKGKCTNTFTMNPKASMFNKWTEKIKSKY